MKKKEISKTLTIATAENNEKKNERSIGLKSLRNVELFHVPKS